MLVGIVFLVLPLGTYVSYFKFLADYAFVFDWLKTFIGVVFLSLGTLETLLYFIRFTSSKVYNSNLQDVVEQILTEVKRTGSSVLGTFLSFRPWMSGEYYVKTEKGVPRYFFPTYLVVLYTEGGNLVVREYLLHIRNKTYEVVGYHVCPISRIVSVGLTQDRLVFDTGTESVGATVDFFEVRTEGGSFRVPIFEEEILSSYGNIGTLKEEMISKVSLIIKLLLSSKGAKE
ncbi:hypothetical protein A4H02_01970 [Fervidobacterium thailandense]|uniref:Uncharacterized protein n=1 Tax=Fervidobacterium thailandense TaxID=1008305 RepID=A0A1E3G4F5_9BACT|nr:hypothetical protein A4H02_01970 [Fervidobacterium thailandense]